MIGLSIIAVARVAYDGAPSLSYFLPIRFSTRLYIVLDPLMVRRGRIAQHRFRDAVFDIHGDGMTQSKAGLGDQGQQVRWVCYRPGFPNTDLFRDVAEVIVEADHPGRAWLVSSLELPRDHLVEVGE